MAVAVGQTGFNIAVVRPEDSEYLKQYKPYIRSISNENETIFLVALKNDKGVWTKYFAILRVNDSIGTTRDQKLSELKGFIQEVYNVHFAKELHNGYTIGEVVLYKGTL